MKPKLILALHPSVRGFGWALIELPDRLLDWSVTRHRRRRNFNCRRTIERLLRQYQPDMVLIENWREVRRSRRICALYEQIVALCAEQKIRCIRLRPSEIRAALGLPATARRDEVAARVAGDFEAIIARLPRRRTAWDSEHPDMALFNAIALVRARLARTSLSHPAHPEAPA